MAETTLYDKALSNYESARVLRNVETDDENRMNIIAYLLSQSLEMAIKYLLEQSGVEYPKTHDIDQLIRIGKEGGVDLYLTEYIEDHAEMFSLWETKSRYVLSFLAEVKKVDTAIIGIEVYFSNIANELNK